jgi:para-aminobenzoate synthetase component I
VTKVIQLQIPQDSNWIVQILSWVDSNFSSFAYFTSSTSTYPSGVFENVIYASNSHFSLHEIVDLPRNKEIVGLIGYDYKNRLEQLSSSNMNLVANDFNESVFFIPEFSLKFKENTVEVETLYDFDFNNIIQHSYSLTENPLVDIFPQTSKSEYVKNVNAIKQHIEEGDIYEMNYCQAFTFKDKLWNPIVGFLDLMKVSLMPFSILFKNNGQFLVCASPERFLKKVGNKLIAQPIKGTIQRGENSEENELLKELLKNSEKERAENLMIVDLMRNDLSKVSLTGSIEVDELFGIYEFPKVNQMISTVTSNVKQDLPFKDIIHATFPMGSMTGAPKLKCMQLIDTYENFKRGWFSGTVGYVDRNGDFDFNVVIRSVLFDRDSGEGFFAVGSAITIDSDASYEYEECLLKASSIIQVLTKNN